MQMADIRKPDEILEEIKTIDKIMMKSNLLYIDYPKDEFLKISIQQAQYKKEVLVEELELSLRKNNRHSINIIFDERISDLDIDYFTSTLNSFRGLASKAYEFVNKKHQEKLPLYFNTVFQSSFGILLTTSFEPNLILEEYGEALRFIFESFDELNKADNSRMQWIVKEQFGGNIKLTRRFSTFYKAMLESGKDFKLSWIPPKKEKFTINISKEKISSIFSLLKENEIFEEGTITYKGIIKGLSLISFKIEFVRSDKPKEILKAKFDKKLAESVKKNLDKVIECKFKFVSELNEITEEEKKHYELLEII